MPATVAYTTANGQRKVKQFADAYAARRFYAHQDKLGHTPTVTRSNAMSPETTPESVAVATTAPAKAPSEPKATRKPTKAPKAKAKAKPASKATKASGKVAKATPKAKGTAKPRGPSVRERALALLAKAGKDMTAKEIQEGIKLGHNLKPTMDQEVERGHLRDVEPGEDGCARYSITAAGRKALEKGTVKPPRATAE
jgi:hypothetical protein